MARDFKESLGILQEVLVFKTIFVVKLKHHLTFSLSRSFECTVELSRSYTMCDNISTLLAMECMLAYSGALYFYSKGLVCKEGVFID